jgi:hypothetical protein
LKTVGGGVGGVHGHHGLAVPRERG